MCKSRPLRLRFRFEFWPVVAWVRVANVELPYAWLEHRTQILASYCKGLQARMGLGVWSITKPLLPGTGGMNLAATCRQKLETLHAGNVLQVLQIQKVHA